MNSGNIQHNSDPIPGESPVENFNPGDSIPLVVPYCLTTVAVAFISSPEMWIRYTPFGHCSALISILR